MCIGMKITNGSLLNAVVLFFVISIEHSTPLPWDSPQQNDEFLRLLVDKAPVGINIFSHYDATTGKVPDARGWVNYDGTVTNRIVQFPPADGTFVNLNKDKFTATMTISDAEYGNGVYHLEYSDNPGWG